MNHETSASQFWPIPPRAVGMEVAGHKVEANYHRYVQTTPAQLRKLKELTHTAFTERVCREKPQPLATSNAPAITGNPFTLAESGHPVLPSVDGRAKNIVGIDVGSSGAWAKLNEGGQWEAQVVSWDPVGGHRLMSVEKNLADLDKLIAKAGGPDKLIVAYEKSRKNTQFGFVNNFTNGRNEEFWRVLLEVRKIHAIAVDPKTWQAYCFKGIPGEKPKQRAREFIRRHCPGTSDWLDDHNKAPREAITDAMCIALWARHYCGAGGGGTA